jgi:hypothetical protein
VTLLRRRRHEVAKRVAREIAGTLGKPVETLYI